MDRLNVQAIFKSIDGEVNGFRGAGELTTFIRLKGCNLQCHFCDTPYAQDSKPENWMTVDEILEKVDVGTKVTISGGEPLCQDIGPLLVRLLEQSRFISVETNGSLLDRSSLTAVRTSKRTRNWENVRWIVDYKLPSSGMERFMVFAAFNALQKIDVIKFVIANEIDYQRALEIRRLFPSWRARKVFSPVISKLDTNWPTELAEMMIRDNLYDVQYSLQIHKVIWPNARQER